MQAINKLGDEGGRALRACPGEDERGAALVEYAILILLIAAVCILGVTILGTNTQEIYSSAAKSVSGS